MGGTNSTLIVQLCCQQSECGNQQLGKESGGSHCTSYARDAPRLHCYFRNAGARRVLPQSALSSRKCIMLMGSWLLRFPFRSDSER
jgi:hypothetical protein